jgi:hypothetical protein
MSPAGWSIKVPQRVRQECGALWCYAQASTTPSASVLATPFSARRVGVCLQTQRPIVPRRVVARCVSPSNSCPGACRLTQRLFAVGRTAPLKASCCGGHFDTVVSKWRPLAGQSNLLLQSAPRNLVAMCGYSPSRSTPKPVRSRPPRCQAAGRRCFRLASGRLPSASGELPADDGSRGTSPQVRPVPPTPSRQRDWSPSTRRAYRHILSQNRDERLRALSEEQRRSRSR